MRNRLLSGGYILTRLVLIGLLSQLLVSCVKEKEPHAVSFALSARTVAYFAAGRTGSCYVYKSSATGRVDSVTIQSYQRPLIGEEGEESLEYTFPRSNFQLSSLSFRISRVVSSDLSYQEKIIADPMFVIARRDSLYGLLNQKNNVIATKSDEEYVARLDSFRTPAGLFHDVIAIRSSGELFYFASGIGLISFGRAMSPERFELIRFRMK